MKPRSLVLALLVLAGSWLPGPAAQADETALAEALFQDARRLFKAKQYDVACPKFEESFRLIPKLGTLLNLATCHDKVGKTGSAWAEYTRAVTMAKEAGEQERVDYAREMLTDLDPRLSKLVVEVPEPVAGIQVLVDGRAIGKAAWETPLPLDPGDHELAARAEGHEPWSRSVTIAGEPGTQRVSVPRLTASDGPTAPTAPPAAPPASSTDSADDDGVSGLAIAGWTLTAVGVVGVGVGSYFGVDTIVKKGDSDDLCEGTLCNQEGVDLRDEAETSATISTIAFAAGLGVAAAGVTLLIIDAVSDDEPEEATARGWLTPLADRGWYGIAGGVTW